MRHDDIRKQYTRHGGAWNDENPLFAVGEQMQYEWERDFIAMKWALAAMQTIRITNIPVLFTCSTELRQPLLWQCRCWAQFVNHD